MMQCTKMFAIRKMMLLPSPSHSLFKIECQCASIRGAYLVQRKFHSKSVTNEIGLPKASEVQKQQSEGMWNKILKKIGIFDRKKFKMMYMGYLVYENIVDKINYSSFYKDFNMADTFFSWFLVTELHIWMAMVRYAAEGEDGKIIRTFMAEAMWKDVKIRFEHLGPIIPGVKRKEIADISDQFRAALIGYDEGIMSDDKILASALWARFFKLECNNPEQLEKLLIYVRKQVHMMDKIPSQEVLSNPTFNWLDLRSIK